MTEKCTHCNRQIDTGLGLLGDMDTYYTRHQAVPGRFPGFTKKEEQYFCSLDCIKKKVKHEE